MAQAHPDLIQLLQKNPNREWGGGGGGGGGWGGGGLERVWEQGYGVQ